MTDATDTLAEQVVQTLTARKLTIATAESCTGGLIGAALTDISGASSVFYGGFITYANAAKIEMIGVSAPTIAEHGAVSAEVARAMADGARTTAGTDLAVAVTGIAGPSGGSEKKPVGLVYLACSGKDGTTVVEKRFGPLNRDTIRKLTVSAALELVLATLADPDTP